MINSRPLQGLSIPAEPLTESREISIAIRGQTGISISRITEIGEAAGSSTNIIQSRVAEQLGLQDQIVLAVRILNGFNMACEATKGEITLPINSAGTIQETKFYVIEGDMRYNALFRRIWIQNMREVPSTLHQELKFPTPDGAKTIYREQPATKEMFAAEEVIPSSTVSTSKGPNKMVKNGAK
uniref:Uncharacterized protein n=1 Tax=Nicotiana tabacum TaxID=4097 RepID=A0A1S4DGY3_TOBAC|nr:PREDICTED: uncharacterized protein LOC107829785 [Nicotiana tabacum]